MFWLSYECFSILYDAFLLKSVISIVKKPKNQNFENEKICWRYHHFTHVHQKAQQYDVKFLRYEVRHKISCNFRPFFALLPPLPLMIPNTKILKKMKKMPGDIILLYIHVYHKLKII